MKNLIVSIDSLPVDVRREIDSRYPDGIDHLMFDFRMPTTNKVFRAIRFATAEVNYLIKVAKKKQDHEDDPSLHD